MKSDLTTIRDMSESAQDYGGLPTETSGCMNGASKLLRLADLAQQLGTEPLAEDARELAARVFEGRFYVACVGQFKRGKSTLLNALIGHEVVRSGFVPVTAVPTVIRFGDALRALVRMQDGPWRDIAMTELKEYISEELNPEDQKGPRTKRKYPCPAPGCPLACVLWIRRVWDRSSRQMRPPRRRSLLRSRLLSGATVKRRLRVRLRGTL
jgi:Dynamin family